MSFETDILVRSEGAPALCGGAVGLYAKFRVLHMGGGGGIIPYKTYNSPRPEALPPEGGFLSIRLGFE
jgi:hypothetical protein